MTQDNGRGESWAEKALRNMAGAALLVLLGWLGTSGQNMSTSVDEMTQSVARIEVQVQSLRSDVNRMEEKVENIYTRNDADRDFRLRDQKLIDHNERIRNLETTGP